MAQAPRALAQQAEGSRHRRGRAQRAAGRGRGPSGPRALGGRPDHRAEPVRDRHRGRAHQQLHAARSPAASGGLRHCPAGQERTCPRWLRRRRDEGRPHHDDGHDACRAAALTDLGPRQRALRARTVQGRHRHRRLLRRPALTLAARHEREHQRPAAPVLPQGQRHLPLEPRGPPRRPGRGQQQASKGPRLEDPGRGPRRATTVAPPSRCCNDRLSPGSTHPRRSRPSPNSWESAARLDAPAAVSTTPWPSHSTPPSKSSGSTAPCIRPESTLVPTSLGTLSSTTIGAGYTRHSAIGPRKRSTTSTSIASSQPDNLIDESPEIAKQPTVIVAKARRKRLKLKKVLRALIDAYVFRQMMAGDPDFYALWRNKVPITISFPPIVDDDEKLTKDTLQMLLDKGIISD